MFLKPPPLMNCRRRRLSMPLRCFVCRQATPFISLTARVAFLKRK